VCCRPSGAAFSGVPFSLTGDARLLPVLVELTATSPPKL
jgi:hypothetical protein